MRASHRTTQRTGHNSADSGAGRRRSRRPIRPGGRSGGRSWGRAAALAAVATVVVLPLTPAANAIPGTPLASVPLPTAVEAPGRYEPATTCSPTPKPGAVKLMRTLVKTYPNSRGLGITRDCDHGGRSEHKEGRAVDWGVRAWIPEEKAAAESFFQWALADDAAGNTAAYARRLGIMYMIYDDRIWRASAADRGWQPYVHSWCRDRPLILCPVHLRHRDHVHISLTWAGARGETSFWSGRVAGESLPDTGAEETGREQRSPVVAPQPPAVAPGDLAAYQHLVLRRGARGAAVSALQRALEMPATDGNFGPLTEAAVKRFQTSRRLAADGVVGRKTWAALGR